MISFSAGGHLAAVAATMAEHRPAAAILGYPVIREDTVHECMAWLSLGCTIGRIFGNPEAKRVIAPLIEEMKEKIELFHRR